MITQELLQEQIEVLQNLEIDAENRVREAREGLLCAKVNFRKAEKHLTELMAVRNELQWHITRLPGGNAGEGVKSGSEGV